MGDNIDERIIFLKSEFSEILFLKQENTQLFEKSRDKIRKLREWYSNYINENQSHLFVFGLDSFHYQGKIIDVEYDDMKRLYFSITNRIYCEYYKLYQIIVKYTEEVVKDKKVTDVVMSNNNFPKYMDLEPYKQYGVETITQIHDIIILLFSSVKNVIDKKHDELNAHRAKNRIGINIDNFIQAFHFEIIIMEQKLALFISYMEFFHKMNIKYLKRFTGKMTLFFGQIDHDIRMDTSSKTKERRKSMIQEFKQDNINTSLMNELAESITSSVSGDVELEMGDSSSSDESTCPISRTRVFDVDTTKNELDKKGASAAAVLTGNGELRELNKTVLRNPITNPYQSNDKSVPIQSNLRLETYKDDVEIELINRQQLPYTKEVSNQAYGNNTMNPEEKPMKSLASQLLQGIIDKDEVELDNTANHETCSNCVGTVDSNEVLDLSDSAIEELKSSSLQNSNHDIVDEVPPENNDNNSTVVVSGEESDKSLEEETIVGMQLQPIELSVENENENENEGMTLHVVEN